MHFFYNSCEREVIVRRKIQNDRKNKDLERIALVADIVAAYVSNNQMASSDLPGFIQLVYRNLCHIECNSPSFPTKREEPTVSIEDSVRPDHIICPEEKDT